MLDEAHAGLFDPQTPPPKSSASLQSESKLLDSVNSLRRELNDVSAKMKAKHTQIIQPPPTAPKVDFQQISRCFPTLKSKVVQSIARCRQQRCALSLVFIQLDDPADVQLLGSSEDRRKLQHCLRNHASIFPSLPKMRIARRRNGGFALGKLSTHRSNSSGTNIVGNRATS